MTRAERKYHAAAILLFLSAALHVPAHLLALEAVWSHTIIAIGILTLLGLGLIRGFRWVAYIAFLAVLTNAVFSLSEAVAAVGWATTFSWGIIVLDLLAGVVLFSLLWSSRPTPADG